MAEYPTKSRATKGVISIKVTERNGLVVGAAQVDDCDQIMMITDAGTLVRTRVSEISIVGRNTQGVILIRTAEDENVVGLQRVAEPVDEEDLLAVRREAAACMELFVCLAVVWANQKSTQTLDKELAGIHGIG